jgi:nucleoid-associated protein YgaU
MESASSRLMAATGCLVLVWIGAYWLYEPSGKGSNGIAPLPDSLSTPLPAARTGMTNPTPAPAPGPKPEASPATPAPEPAIRPAPEQPPAPQPKPPAPASTVVPPEFETYTVKQGETFETIAKARYGSSRLHTVIARANPMKDPRRLKPGDQIRLPKDPSNIQGKPVVTPPANPTPASNSTDYLVQKGDTLSGIAAKVWGSGKNWRVILEANATLLPSEDALRPGMRLRIPSKPKD